MELTPEENKAKSALIEEARAMTQAQKVHRILELTEARREEIKKDLKARYPQASEHELKMRFAVEWLGPKLAKEAYGWENAPEDV
ncbi:MAG: hypothetical protein ACJ74J_05915 [Blastocatellia bacterium]